MHASAGVSGRPRLRLVEAPAQPDADPAPGTDRAPGPVERKGPAPGDDTPAPGSRGHLALVWAEGQPSLVALPSPISPGKARAVHHYARLAAEARSARAD